MDFLLIFLFAVRGFISVFYAHSEIIIYWELDLLEDSYIGASYSESQFSK